MLPDYPTVTLDPIPGYPGYLANRLGIIFSVKKGPNAVPLRPGIDPEGRLYVCIIVDSKKIYRKVHRLILETYSGPCPPGMECLHGPGGRLNNSINNLRWGTKKENAADKLRDGTNNHGTRNGNAKLSPDDIPIIRSMKILDAARKFGISFQQASRIKNHKQWSHID
jgi:hypothetical protein